MTPDAMTPGRPSELFERAPCGFLVLDADGGVLTLNRTLLDWLGAERAQSIGTPFERNLPDARRSEFRNVLRGALASGEPTALSTVVVRAGGGDRGVQLLFVPLKPDETDPAAVAVTLIDASTTAGIEASLDRLVRVDALTGLPNAQGFREQANREFARSRRLSSGLSLAVLEVDGPGDPQRPSERQSIDTLHRHVGVLLEGALRRTDIAARLDEETFAVLMPDTPDEAALEVSERLRESASVCPPPAGAGAFTISVGVAAFGGADRDLDALLRRALLALEDARHAGGNQVRFDRG